MSKKNILQFLFILFLAGTYNIVKAQSRIEYWGKDIFLNGSNVAWVNYSRDLGPTSLNITKFKNFFQEFHNAGGNVMRLWLHNDATATPIFSNSGYITGPGPNAVAYLQQILDAARQYDVGLQLCLFGFNLQRKTIGEPYLSRNKKFLTDTTVIRSYINNSLIPMMDAVKGHPAIFAWEIFNEPEGMTNEFGWGDINHVPMADIQRFVNLITGAIHRADPFAKVTNGANRINTCSDVTALSKASAQSIYDSLTDEQKRDLEKIYEIKYDMHLTAREIVEHFYKPDAGNLNYYRNDRLIAAGGDPLGTLDFYNIHFYSDGGTKLSPFHHPYSFWKLDKPLVVAEFFMTDVVNVNYSKLYENLYLNGYAGAMSWQWLGDTSVNDNAKNENHTRTVETLQNIFQKYYDDIFISKRTGTIYRFDVSPSEFMKGESVILNWETEMGSVVTINSEPVDYKGTKILKPETTTTYTLITLGENPSYRTIVAELIDSSKNIPAGYSLQQNYPNPFNLTTKIDFMINLEGQTTLEVFDILGQKIETLFNKYVDAGNYHAIFNASKFTSGIYFYKLTSGSFINIKKMIFVK